MRMVKMFVDLFLVVVVLPVVLVSVLGFAFSPLAPIAHAAESPVVLVANDIAE